MQIVLYSDDINLLTYWQKIVSGNVAIAADLDELYGFEFSLIVVNRLACGSTCNEFLAAMQKAKNRVLVLDRVPEIATAKQLIALGAMGYGNALMRGHFLSSALDTLKEGMLWLHPEFISELIGGLEFTKKDTTFLLQKLTQREQEVALLLSDGYTYKDVAQKLEITPRTIKAHAQSIYTKLQVKDRIGLALLLR